MNQILPCSRRELLQRSGLGLGALGLASLLGESGHQVQAKEIAGPLAPRAPHFAGKAKRVIHFFLNGGPSHVDTFDPKPALEKYAGQTLPQTLLTERKTGAAFPSPFKFKKYGQSGLEISELFAQTAQHADDIAVIRSMYAQVPNHEPSLMLMNCGDSVQPRPSVGAWVLYGLGTENQNLPGFLAMCPGGLPIKDTENWQSAFLPGAFQGTFIDSKHQQLAKLIENIAHPHASTATQRRQLDLLAQLNAEHRAARIDTRLDARIQTFELAFRMQTEAADAFDLARETKEVREAYGDGVHGRQTLIARRLLERGVRYVQLWHGAGQPWDNHDNIAGAHRKLAGEIDRPIAALIADLKRLGMFEDTLVVWGGEFGRTPTVELGGDGKAKLGRDHNHYGFSVWLAGGGIKGGQAYGATDEFGFKAVENPTSAHDLHATILHLLGFDHERLTYRYAGRDFRLTDVAGRVIKEIVA
ncbi:hypothetical protein ETAA8_04360 [Anatilimnocola aggregata]|uniref:DUF1501 domain-containing protein n=1 Tax=Anatilimnocola aggregata TaxID=2528021 RepID=A0A517Y5A1_9BACT|nr:DUF1501 domain-containing protein [Anatilimnocola aggregata]QDU25370.1 hypothetical protein ETAA8_04360 [Anatilimnocola aggregata]